MLTQTLDGREQSEQYVLKEPKHRQPEKDPFSKNKRETTQTPRQTTENIHALALANRFSIND